MTGENWNGRKTWQQKAVRIGAECFMQRSCNIICTAGMLLSRYVIAIFLYFEGNWMFVVLLCYPWTHTKQRNEWCNWHVLLQNGAARITEIATMNLWSSVTRHFVSGSFCRCFEEKDCLHFQGWSEPVRNRPVRNFLPTSRAARVWELYCINFDRKWVWCPRWRPWSVCDWWEKLQRWEGVLARWMSRGWNQSEAGFLWRCVTVVVSL